MASFHVACRRGVSLYVVERLLDCLPQSSEIKTNKGSTPLICARKGGDSQRHKDIIEYLENYIQKQQESAPLISVGKVDNVGMPVVMSTTIHHRHVHARGA